MKEGRDGWQVDLTPARPGHRQPEPRQRDEGADGESLSIADLIEAVDRAAIMLAEVGAKLDAVRNHVIGVGYPEGVSREIAKVRRRIRESGSRIPPRDPSEPRPDASSASGPTP